MINELIDESSNVCISVQANLFKHAWDSTLILAFLQAPSNVNGDIRIFSHRSNYEILGQISIRSSNLLKKKKFLYRDQSFLRQSHWVPAESYNLYAPGSAPLVYFSKGMRARIGHSFINYEWRKVDHDRNVFRNTLGCTFTYVKGGIKSQICSLVSILQITIVSGFNITIRLEY